MILVIREWDVDMMKKPQIRNIIPHFVFYEHHPCLSDKINELHVQIIKRTLGQLDITAQQKTTVVDQIIANIKSRETNDTIQ